MPRIEISQSINVYEVDGDENRQKPILFCNSHWNDNEMVVLIIGGHTYTVIGEDMKLAVVNAMNSGQ